MNAEVGRMKWEVGIEKKWEVGMRKLELRLGICCGKIFVILVS